MSFADEVREELCELPVRQECCRRALTEGLLICAQRGEGKSMTVRYRQETVATLASAMIRRQYGKAPDSEMTGACGHRYYDLVFSSPAFYKRFLQWHESPEGEREAVHIGCDACRAAFLRGAFLACGTLNDPHKSYHLEFLLPNGALADVLETVLTEAGYPPRRIARPRGIELYYKNSESVEDMIALLGSQHHIFRILNNRIERDIRNNENRATNCVAKNIEKSISASAAQIEAINALMERGRLESLPEPLRETAMLRYRNPDTTLDELAARHAPPISKSGLNHRLQKILSMAKELK